MRRSGSTTSSSGCGRTARPSTSRPDMVATKGGRTLIIWRHGETDHNANGIWQGQLDTALSDKGREQARTAAAELAGYRPSVIVSSDLERAADTARTLAS